MTIEPSVLNAILRALVDKNNIHLLGYLKINHNITDRGQGKLYQTKLKEDGHIRLRVISAERKLASITDQGRLFINGGGYSEISVGAKKLILKDEKYSLNPLKNLGATDEEVIKYFKKKNNNESDSYIKTEDKQIINYVLKKLEEAKKKLHSTKFFEGNALRSSDEAIRTLFKKVLKEEHRVFERNPFSVLEPEDLIAKCDLAIFDLEIELIESKSDLSFLNPKLHKACVKQFLDGHYAEAVFNACRKVEIEVKRLTNCKKTGMPLMGEVFNPVKPLIKLSEDENIQKGYMHLFMGAFGAIRNDGGHYEVEYEEHEAYDLLHYVNYLMTVLETKII